MANKIKAFISQIMMTLSSRIKMAAENMYTPPVSRKEAAHQRWLEDRGDLTKRLLYPLTSRSVVFDFGGYEGGWASDIFAMYQPTIYVFEPVKTYADRIRKRFSTNKKIIVVPYGLSNDNKELSISLEENASSAYKQSEKMSKIKLRCFRDFIHENNIDFIDLMKMNIEGGEYDLLDEIIDSGFINKIGNIQIQFHDFVPNAEKRMRKIQRKLSETHKLSYQYPFVWENWFLKK